VETPSSNPKTGANKMKVCKARAKGEQPNTRLFSGTIPDFLKKASPNGEGNIKRERSGV